MQNIIKGLKDDYDCWFHINIIVNVMETYLLNSYIKFNQKTCTYEWHFDTQSKVDLVFFGVLNEKTQEVEGAIKIPGMLSFLADNNVNTKVEGLNDFPKMNYLH